MKLLNRSIAAKLSCCWTLLFGASLTFQAQAQPESRTLPSEVTVNGVELVLIPEGWYYPSEASADKAQAGAEQAQEKVWLGSYYIAKYEARANDLVELLNSAAGKDLNYDGGDANCAIRKTLLGGYKRIRADEDLPATHLSWNQVNTWAQWKGMRLPSVAEWEKAARGTDQRRYPWGDAYPDDTYAGFLTRSECFTWPVDSFKKGRSPYGIHNMAGNIYEYTADSVGKNGSDSLSPSSSDQTESGKSTSDGRKILKGGRWASTEPHIRIDSYYSYPADKAYNCYGARFAMDAEAVIKHLNQGSATVTKL